MKIYVFDPWGAHWDETAEALRGRGHEVRKGGYWGPELVEWSDVSIFHAVQNNLIQASRKTENPEDTTIVAEAVDIDVYAGHMGGVEWDFVDHLVYMADHMRGYAERRFDVPEDIPRHVIKGGVDLDDWTLVDRPVGYKIAWIGHLWIAKNLIGALQIFNQVIEDRPYEPWELHALGRKWSPPHWWRRACEGYLDANPELEDRFTLTEEYVPSVDEWLDDKSYLLHTGLKEAYGYVIAQSAAKGIRPIVMQTMGTDAIWPQEWIFQTHAEAVSMFEPYERSRYRETIERGHDVDDRAAAFEELFRWR